MNDETGKKIRRRRARPPDTARDVAASGLLSPLLEFLPPRVPPADLGERIDDAVEAIQHARIAADFRARSRRRILAAGLAGAILVMLALVLGGLVFLCRG